VPTLTKPPFSVVALDGVLAVSGEIDLASAEDFLNAVVSMADPTREVVLDVTALEFVDATGLRAIVRLAEEACPFGVVILSPRDNLLKVIDIVDAEQFAGIRVER
jgi:anti-anti-sigma factor